MPDGKNYEFINGIVGGVVSKGYIPGCEKGFHEAMVNGVLAGYKVVDVGVKLIDGKEHPVDSSEMSFKIASRMAFKEAMKQAHPVLLEPIMELSVYADQKYVGDILSGISSKRGRVLGQESLGGIEVIKALVPQKELLRYSIDLKSITSGTASYEVKFNNYQPITGKLADDVIAKAKAEMKEVKRRLIGQSPFNPLTEKQREQPRDTVIRDIQVLTNSSQLCDPCKRKRK